MRIIKELYDYREMLSNLVKKDLKVRYKGSVLGFTIGRLYDSLFYNYESKYR